MPIGVANTIQSNAFIVLLTIANTSESTSFPAYWLKLDNQAQWICSYTFIAILEV